MLATAKIEIESLVEMELPPLPGSAMRVAALVEDMNSSARVIADAIGSDPVLAARVLRTANSPLYSLERRITALPMAVNALGNHAIHMLVIMSVASDSFNGGKRSPLGRALWEHSVAVGLAAREVSLALGMRGAEEAFLCGLLHDIGKLLLLRYDPELYAQVLESSAERGLLECEMEVYGYTHAQVGALVSRRWNLPEEISYAIYNHHQPSEAGQSLFMARVIDVADALANAAGIGMRQGKSLDQEAWESMMALRLTDEQLKSAWEKVEASYREMISLFS